MRRLTHFAQLTRWVFKENWEDLGDLHYLLELAGASSPHHPDKEVMARRHQTDFHSLWEHAQQSLLAALLHKSRMRTHADAIAPDKRLSLLVNCLRTYSMHTRMRLVRVLEEYLDALEVQYLRWVLDDPHKDMQEFLRQAPPLSLPTLRGGARTPADEQKLFAAAYYGEGLRDCLNDWLKRSYLNPFVEQRDIKAALGKFLGSLDGVPKEKVSRWTTMGRQQTRAIALEVAAWKFGIATTHLEKRGLPLLLKRPLLQHLAVWRKEVRLPIQQHIREELAGLEAAVSIPDIRVK